MTTDGSDVLVVDRVESAAETVSGLQDRLETLSFALAADVPEATAVVRDGRVDCVVSNFEVPRADGVEFVGAFALLDAVRDVDADVPFVLYSDVGNEAIAETAFERGVTEYVPKTVGGGSVCRLADRVERVVEHRRAQRRFERQPRIDELLRDVNQSLVRADDRDTIESTVVDRLAADGGYAFATWVRPDDPDAAIAPVANVLESGDLETSDCTTEDLATAMDADGAWVDDVDDSPGPIAAVPVAYEDETYGTIVVGTQEAVFDDTERAVLAELGDTVGDAIDAAETRQALHDQNERLEAFASVVSHDLRNPLAVARAYASELDDSDSTESDADAVDAIEESLERMDVLVDDMLELARNGADDRDRRYTDLADLAHQAWGTVDTGDATLDVDSDLGQATVDRSRVAQLFENAYRNSVEHGSTGSRLEAGDSVEHGSTGSRLEADDSVEHSEDAVAVTVAGLDDGFAIADDGPGIPPEEREHVRDLGYSGDDGTGLGLAIVQDVLDAHDWTLELTASDTGGARLEIHDVDVER